VDWIHTAQDRDQWRDLVNTAMDLPVANQPSPSQELCSMEWVSESVSQKDTVEQVIIGLKAQS
jgi:hypothetical protein